MVDFNGIGDLNAIKGVNNVKGTSSANIGKTEAKLGSFGYGFNTSNVGFTRNVVPEFLANKFADVEPPKYTKNIGQLVINDRDYIPDKPFEEDAFCEV